MRFPPLKVILCIGVAFISIYVIWTWFEKPSQIRSPALPKSPFFQTEDLIDPCSYHQILADMLAPESLPKFGERIAALFNTKTNKTTAMNTWLYNEKSGSESFICIQATADQKVLSLDAEPANGKCAPRINKIPNFSIALRSHHTSRDTKITELKIFLGLDRTSKKRLFTASGEFFSKAYSGFTGWNKALQNISDSRNFGFQIHTGLSQPPSATNNTREVKTRISLEPQLLGTQYPTLANYLLRMDRLAEWKSSWVLNEKKFLTTWMNTDQTRFETKFALDQRELVPLEGTPWEKTFKPSGDTSSYNLKIKNDVMVEFRGLEIKVTGLTFDGAIENSPKGLLFRGNLQGDTRTTVTGEIKSMVLSSLSSSIKDLVKEQIERELGFLAKGNDGKGWIFDISLTNLNSHNTLEMTTVFESRVDIARILKHQYKDQQEGVIPNSHARGEFNALLRNAGQSISKDFLALSTKCRK